MVVVLVSLMLSTPMHSSLLFPKNLLDSYEYINHLQTFQDQLPLNLSLNETQTKIKTQIGDAK